jgi:hypothetical protein
MQAWPLTLTQTLSSILCIFFLVEPSGFAQQQINIESFYKEEKSFEIVVL